MRIQFLIFKDRHKSLKNGQKLSADISRDQSVSLQRESAKFGVDGWDSIDVSDNISRGRKECFQLGSEFAKRINSNIVQFVQVGVVAEKSKGSRGDSLIKLRRRDSSLVGISSRPVVSSGPVGSVVVVLAKTSLNQAEKSNGLKN